MQTFFILGRQKALGLAELESLFGKEVITSTDGPSALLDISVDKVHFDRLGGSIKCGQVIGVANSIDIRRIEHDIIKLLPGIAESLTGKIQLGVSVYGLEITPSALLATGLNLKKALRKAGHSVRLVPGKELALNSASVIHNNLTGSHGIELVLIRHERQTIIARTTASQDIDSYTIRDRGRPKRDARVGMLPPKLAQIIINLAADGLNPLYGGVILDPFCGTGVVLQEATLMGFDVYGSDLEQRMVDYSDDNLMWLLDQPFCSIKRPPEYDDDPDWRYFNLEQGDATHHIWKFAPSAVACETYLGKPFTSLPSSEVLAQTIAECNLIIKKFLQNIGSQIPPSTRLCLAIPAWQTRPDTFKHVPLIDSLSDLGYNRISFEHVRQDELIYYRPDQVVARQLLVIEKQ